MNFIKEMQTERSEWVLSLLDVLRDSCPNLTIAPPDIDMDVWTVYANMCHGLQLIAMAYDTRIDVGARQHDSEFVPLIIADDRAHIWSHVSRIALDAKAQAEQLLEYQRTQQALEQDTDSAPSFRFG